MEEWDAEHARPLLAQPVPDRVRSAIHDAKWAVADLIAQRPEAARGALREVSVGSEHLWRRLEPATLEPAAERMRSTLDALSQPEAGGR